MKDSVEMMEDISGAPGGTIGGAGMLAELIVRSATDFAIVTTTPTGIINSWSPGAEKVMGWRAADAIGQSIGMIFTPEDRADGRPDEEMRCAREDGCATDERWHMKADGTRFWANGELQPLEQDGALVGFVKILRDRTEHRDLLELAEEASKQAAQANAFLKGESERLREMFEAAPGFIAVFRGPTHIYEIANASYMRLAGHREIIGKPIREALPEIEGQGYFELFDQVFATGKPIVGNNMAVMLSPSPGAELEQRIVDYVFQPIRDPAGAITGVFLEGFDVTEAAQARASAEKLGAEQAAILSQLSEGVIATDAAGRISFVNEAAERLHGVARLDVTPDQYSDTYQLLTEDGAPYPPAELPLARAVSRGETVTDARWRIRRPDGSEVLAIGNAQPVIADGAQIGAVLTVRDDTERRYAESALDESRLYLRLLLDSTQEAFYSVDTAGATTLCNVAFLDLLGFEREEDAVGRKLHDVIHHSHPNGRYYAKEDCPIYQCAQLGTPAVVCDELFYKLDGTPFPVEYRVSPIRHDGVLQGAICTFVDITERKATEQALRDTEERYRLAGQATNDAIWDWDFATNGVLWNEALHTAFGHRPEDIEATGDWWIAQIHPDDRVAVDTSIHAVIDGTETAWTGEYRFRRGNGSYADVLDRGTVVRDAEGRATRMIGAMLDLTQRKGAEESLRQSEAQFRELADNIPTLCWTANADGHIYWYNQRWYDYSGTSPETQLGWGWEDIHDPAFLPQVSERWTRAIATGTPFAMTFPLKGKNGKYRRFLTRIVPIADADGKVVRWFGTNVDVEDQVLAEEHLRASETALTELNRTLEARVAEAMAERDMIWRTSQDLFAVIDASQTYRSVNPAWTGVLGYAPDELIGKQPGALLHPDDLDFAIAEFSRAADGEVVSGVDFRMRHKGGGYRWISWTGVPYDDVLYVAGRDVTQRKELEEQLRQSQKMEAVGQLTGGIAHDFNNLLTIVSGNIDMARRSLGEDGNARALRSLGNAAKGADRAAALTQRLLAFSRRQPLQPRATDVNKLITGMTELLDRALGETVELQVVAGAGLWRVEVDPNQLENAILNLAVNARDAMPGGGKLTVETTNSHIDEAYAAAQREVAPGQYVLVSVTDTGEGMPPDIVAKAFDPFFSTKEVGKGTGLGLSQVYGYVKQSGGHVKIYSEAGHGTTIKLYLPRLIADMNAVEEVEPDAAPALQGQESILVVEDDDDVRIYTVDSLRELGYRVLEAHDGASALRLLERQEEAPRLLLTDVVMPGMSGRDLADQARATWPGMRVLFTTGYARNAIVHGGRLDAGVELLLKPFTYEALATKVREVLDKSGVERALILDASDEARLTTAALLASLGFDTEPAANVREALGKLRAAGGMFDVVLLSDALPVGNLDAVIEEIHAVRSDLPILLLSAREASELERRHADSPCVGAIAMPPTKTGLQEQLALLRVRCAQAH